MRLSPVLHLRGAACSLSIIVLVVLAPVPLTSLAAQQGGGFELSIANIMRGPEVYGRSPEGVRWSADGRWIYFRWVPPGTDWREPMRDWRVRAVRGATPEAVTRAHLDSVAPLLADGTDSPDRRLRVVIVNGDLHLVDLRRGTARLLSQTVAAASNPQFSADGRRVYFIRENNLFSIDLDGGALRQHTDIRSGPAPREPEAARGQRAVLEAQQRELFGVIRDAARRDSIQRAERLARDSARLRPVHLNRTERVTSLRVAPSGRAVILTTTTPAEGSLQTRVPNYVTQSGYTEEMTVRTKVGDEQGSGRIGYMTLADGAVHWLNVTPDDSSRVAAQASVLGWNESGTHALVMAVSRDFKTRWLHVVSAEGGAVRTVDVLRDTAWVNGPCFGCGGWYDEGRRLWFVSEASGHAHLYTMAADGSDRRQLTSGDWEVLDVELARDGRHFYLHSHEVSPFERHFYRVPVGGGARTRITTRKGGHTAELSPDERMIANMFSTANRPPELFLMENRAGAEMSQLTTSPTAEWLATRWIEPEIVRIRASDGVQVPARIYRPADMGAQPNGAAVIFVHGAGYLHNVHEYWSTYSREYMFHHFLASRGYVVLDIDYRGSAGYGRDWRTAIYRHMGGRDLQDHVDGARWLQREMRIDPERIGIYGGSYGGFITLMALFTEPEWFGAGAALRSVTDWAHYNHGYTGRILNFPDTDSLSYRRSSPIFFAEGLEDPLLIAHGMVDVNVHFQDVVRLAQRLIELGKTRWEMAVYPVEDHGFVRPESWTDEYRRIFELFESALHPGRARAAESGSSRGERPQW